MACGSPQSATVDKELMSEETSLSAGGGTYELQTFIDPSDGSTGLRIIRFHHAPPDPKTVATIVYLDGTGGYGLRTESAWLPVEVIAVALDRLKNLVETGQLPRHVH